MVVKSVLLPAKAVLGIRMSIPSQATSVIKDMVKNLAQAT